MSSIVQYQNNDMKEKNKEKKGEEEENIISSLDSIPTQYSSSPQPLYMLDPHALFVSVLS